METLHVRFDFDEAVNSKKELLSSEIDLLNILKKIKDYKDLRKKELIKKSLLRTKLRQLAKEIVKFRNSLPKTKEIELEKKQARKISLEKGKKGRIESELKEIKERLGKLS